MSAILLAGPAAEPLSLAEAKAFLRVAHDDDDALIAALIAAARGQIEALTRRALLVQTWRIVLDRWPTNGRVTPRIGPLRSVRAARLFDSANMAHALDLQCFAVDAARDAIAAPCWSLPPPGRDLAGIEFDIEVGFGTLASEVPEPQRQAIRLLLSHWYDNLSRWEDPAKRARVSEATKARMADPAVRQRIRDGMRRASIRKASRP
jgi:uncharacterized phiE125 gp8 family phage protein